MIYRRFSKAFFCGLIILLSAGRCVAQSNDSINLNVMTLNVWTQDNDTAQLVDIIQAGDADVVGIQELSNGGSAALSAALGWNYSSQTRSGTRIFSRHPILGNASDNQGVQIEFSPGHNAWVFNVHLTAYPYQPYDLRDSPSLTESQLISSAENTRGAEIDRLLNSVNASTVTSERVFVTGDFNEPSHLDWTAAAAAATDRDFDKKVWWPGSEKMANAGFSDSFRTIRPDEVNDRGYTWTPGYPPPNQTANEVHDRIDFVYSRGDGVAVTQSRTIGYDASNPNTDIAVPGYSTDHRAVVSDFTIAGLEGSSLTFSRLQHNPGSDVALNGGNYGDRLVTTPNIELEFRASGGSTWDTYDGDADGPSNNWNVGVAQLQTSSGAAEFDLEFSVDDGFGVVVDSFDLVDYASFAAGHEVDWELWAGTPDSGTLLVSATEFVAANGVTSVDTNYTEPVFGTVTLRFVHVTGDGSDLAVDNIGFRQISAIPEPSGLLSLILVGCVLLRSRTRRQVGMFVNEN